MSNIVKLRALFIPTILVISSTQAGQVYKWVDENGKVHFGDRPKPEQNATEIEIKPSNRINSLQGERLEKQRRLLDHFERKRSDKKQTEAKERQDQAKRDTECRKLRKTLNDYHHSSGIYIDQPDGSRSYLNKQQRRAEIERMEKMVADNCK